MKDSNLKVVFSVIAICLGIASLVSSMLSGINEIEFFLFAFFVSLVVANYGLKEKIMTAVLCSLGMFLLVFCLLIIFLKNKELSFIVTMAGPALWGGIIIWSYIFPIYEKYQRKKIFLGEKMGKGENKYIRFYTSPTKEVYLGSVEFKNKRWQVYVTEGDARLKYGEGFFKRVERLAHEKHPNG